VKCFSGCCKSSKPLDWIQVKSSYTEMFATVVPLMKRPSSSEVNLYKLPFEMLTLVTRWWFLSIQVFFPHLKVCVDLWQWTDCFDHQLKQSQFVFYFKKSIVFQVVANQTRPWIGFRWYHPMLKCLPLWYLWWNILHFQR